MNSVCLRSRTEFINKDTDSLLSSSIVSTEKKTKIFSQQYISYNFYHLTSRVYGELLTLPSPRQEVCTAYDTRRPAMHVNIHLLTVLNGEYFHPTISHCTLMCTLNLHPPDMATMLVVNPIHHFHIAHNAPGLSPKFYIPIVPNSSGYYSRREIQDDGYVESWG